MIAAWFEQVRYVYKECNNLQDSKSILMMSVHFGDSAEPWCIFGLTTFLGLVERKNSTFLYLQFLLLLSKRELIPESCLAISHPRASYL